VRGRGTQGQGFMRCGIRNRIRNGYSRAILTPRGSSCRANGSFDSRQSHRSAMIDSPPEWVGDNRPAVESTFRRKVGPVAGGGRLRRTYHDRRGGHWGALYKSGEPKIVAATRETMGAEKALPLSRGLERPCDCQWRGTTSREWGFTPVD
jgi:hypothetical protein